MVIEIVRAVMTEHTFYWNSIWSGLAIAVLGLGFHEKGVVLATLKEFTTMAPNLAALAKSMRPGGSRATDPPKESTVKDEGLG